MIGMNEVVSSALISGLVGGAVTSLALSYGYPRMRDYFRQVPPRIRGILVFALLILPLMAGLSFFALILSPVVDYGTVLHHCHTSTIGSCVPHSLSTLEQLPGLITLMGVLGIVVWPLIRSLGPVQRLSLLRRSLHKISRYDAERGIFVVDDARPLAFSMGFISPSVFLSSGLVAHLSAEERDTVIHHEYGHVTHRDGVWQLLGHVLSIGHGKQTRGLLLADLHLAAEQACDAYAARRVGDRLTVAQTILKVERMSAGHDPFKASAVPGIASLGVTGSSVPDRVDALLSPEGFCSGRWACWAFLGAVLLALVIFLAAEPLHHAIESIFIITLG
jgi:hypothetical protein